MREVPGDSLDVGETWADDEYPHRWRTRWVVFTSVLVTLACCAGAVVALFGPSTLARAWDATNGANRAACAALATSTYSESGLRRAISLGEANTNESYAYWAYSLASARADASTANFPQQTTYDLRVQDSIAHLNAICASWGLR